MCRFVMGDALTFAYHCASMGYSSEHIGFDYTHNREDTISGA
jgi:hypothetical protein